MNKSLPALDRRDVIASAKRVAEAVYRSLPPKLSAATSKSIKAGMLQSGAHIREIRAIIESEFANLCKAASIKIAEICGKETPRYFEFVDELLRTFIEPFLDQFEQSAWPGLSRAANEDMAREQRILLESELSDLVFGTSEDLRLGIADGKRAESREQVIMIDNRGGAGQIAVNSPGAVQTIGGNQSVSVEHISKLINLIEIVRKEIIPASLEVETRDQLEDLIVSVEREIKSPAPQLGRLKRTLTSLSALLKEVGVATASTLIAEYISQLLI